MAQTAVEWLIEELKKVHHPTEAMIMYAKKLEKQQQIDFATDFARDYIGFDSVSNDPNAATPAEMYYNQTFKK